MLYIHENNYQTKIRNNYNGKGEEIKKFYEEKYLKVKEELNSITFSSEDEKTFEKAAKIMDNYINEINEFESKAGIKSQSKFRATFIEEISTYLFKNIEPIKSGALGIFNKGIFAGMKINSELDIDILTKDVDFCIGKKVNITIDGRNSIDLIIPIICVEVKTYLDATMFGEVKYSSMQIKNATPNARTYILMEGIVVAEEKILAARHDNALDEMFVLRNRGDNNEDPISPKVLKSYYEEIVRAIDESTIFEEIIYPGKLLKPND